SSSSALASRSAKSSSMTTLPTKLVTACAPGATASQRFSAPHSSGSKWLKPIHRSDAGSITRATASSVWSNVWRKPVCMRNGSSSRMTNWLNWMPYAGWKAEIRKTSGAISLTFALIVLLSQLGRRAAARPVDRAHEPDVVAVRVLDDSVARAPERVVRRLAARVAGGGHVRVGRVDGLARRDPEADDDAAPARRPVRPPGVVRLRERRAVEVEAEAVREVDVDVVRPALGSPDRRV